MNVRVLELLRIARPLTGLVHGFVIGISSGFGSPLFLCIFICLFFPRRYGFICGGIFGQRIVAILVGYGSLLPCSLFFIGIISDLAMFFFFAALIFQGVVASSEPFTVTNGQNPRGIWQSSDLQAFFSLPGYRKATKDPTVFCNSCGEVVE